MVKRLSCLLTAIMASLAIAPVVMAKDAPAPVGSKISELVLTDVTTSKPWSLLEQGKDAKVVVILFMGAGCPVNTAYAPRINEMVKRYAPDKVQFVGINSHLADDVKSVAENAKEFRYSFPVLKDEGTKYADKLAVERVPSAVVLDTTRTVRYAGRIDDQYSPGVFKANQETRELANAIESIVEGNPIKVAHAPAAGCKLTRERKAVASASLTYHKDVASIIQSRCLECHRTGEAAPFALQSYAQVKSWSSMIREVVADNVMPPWHADAPFGHFKNDRRLAPEDKKTLLSWIDQGCPEGDIKDTPPARDFVKGWRLGREPDEVIKMSRTVQVPAFGLPIIGFPYQYIMSGEPFSEDRWIEAVEVRPDYRGVIHHIIAFVLPPGSTFRELAGPNFGQHMLGAYVPGDQPVIAPPGMARKVTKGSRILFELHYTPNGRPGPDCSMIGLCYSKTAPKNEIYNLSVTNNRFQIPPNVAHHEVTKEHTFKHDSTLLSLTPHMHVRGKAFRYEITTPDGKKETILNVPKYDFSWQMSYDFAKPVQVPAGTKLLCTALYDNSSSNPFNPDPSKTIRWGNQTWNEMMIGFVTYYETK